ncbi:hypothetical protein CHCC20369_4289 [Bacillus licheniformis]|nr:hypothetical protein CHCC20369_4289 [Bacillus licheniformis]
MGGGGAVINQNPILGADQWKEHENEKSYCHNRNSAACRVVGRL